MAAMTKKKQDHSQNEEQRERREHARYPLEIPARLKITQKDGQSVTADFKTENISAGGALIRADQSLEMGAKVEVHLVLPVDKLRELDAPTVDVNLSGRVIRLADSGAVIGFDPTFRISRSQKPVEEPSDQEVKPLTKREREILTLMASGAPNQDIADHLSIGLSTVKSHIYNLYKKIGVKNRFQAILWYSHHLNPSKN